MQELIVGTAQLTARPAAAAHEGCASFRLAEGKWMPASGAGRRQYVGTSRFWFKSFQKWQSEFFVVGEPGSALDLAAGERLTGVQTGLPCQCRDRTVMGSICGPSQCLD